MRVPSRSSLVLALAMSLPFAALSSVAQTAVPPDQGDHFKDTSMFKPPAGAKVAVLVWEDLTCPACAHAYPIIHAAVAHYGIPLIERDFLLLGPHAALGDREAAIWSRYLHDKVSPKAADDYRAATFAAQTSISSKDDMLNFTRRYFQTHNLQFPFVADPTGQLNNEVMADSALGNKFGLTHTPTVIVCSNNQWVQVVDVSQLYQTIDRVMAQAGAAVPAAAAPTKKVAAAEASAPAKKPAAAKKTAQ
jgi:protein-disulfide isomerase